MPEPKRPTSGIGAYPFVPTPIVYTRIFSFTASSAASEGEIAPILFFPSVNSIMAFDEVLSPRNCVIPVPNPTPIAVP